MVLIIAAKYECEEHLSVAACVNCFLISIEATAAIDPSTSFLFSGRDV